MGENWSRVYNKFSLGKNINAASDNHFFRIMQGKILLAIPKLEQELKDVNLKITKMRNVIIATQQEVWAAQWDRKLWPDDKLYKKLMAKKKTFNQQILSFEKGFNG